MEEKIYWFWLLNVANVTPREITNLLERYGSPKEIYNAERVFGINENQQFRIIESKKSIDSLVDEYEAMTAKGIRLITRDDEDYPTRLRGIYDEPYGIFVRGELPKENKRFVSIIGARRATQHGKWMASKLGEDLAKAGIVVISGMAEGIDGSSHVGCLDGGGKTIAVLGSGVDVCFPMLHEPLYRRIMKSGAIVSEYGPGTPGIAYHFPMRNRIISALSDIVVVVEAREKSGTLITVSTALSQGRDVMAVPGRPDDPLSVGCNRLIKEGAGCCLCAQDIIDQLEISSSLTNRIVPSNSSFSPQKFTFKAPCTGNPAPSQVGIKDASKEPLLLSLEEKQVLEILGGDIKHIDIIAASLAVDISRLFAVLSEMEIKGLIMQVSPGRYMNNIKNS